VRPFIRNKRGDSSVILIDGSLHFTGKERDSESGIDLPRGQVAQSKAEKVCAEFEEVVPRSSQFYRDEREGDPIPLLFGDRGYRYDACFRIYL